MKKRKAKDFDALLSAKEVGVIRTLHVCIKDSRDASFSLFEVVNDALRQVTMTEADGFVFDWAWDGRDYGLIPDPSHDLADNEGAFTEHIPGYDTVDHAKL